MDKPFVVCDFNDRNASPDPDRAISIEVQADGSVAFVIDFKKPGCVEGVFSPGTASDPAGVVAHVYPVNAADLTEETDCVTCLDTYEAIREAREAAKVTDDDTQPLPGDWINTAPGALRPGDVFYIDPDAADYSYPTLAPDGKPERGFYMATATIGTFEATRYATRSDAYQAAADLDSST
jgi:hypothetical protein